jgi:hypothetical protein
MKREFILGKLDSLMDWTPDEAQKEFAWLRLMSRMKYDDYHDFLAGMRFIESLADWLQQFPKEKRQHAYAFIRKRLLFLSVREMRHLVELFYPDTVEPRLKSEAASIRDISSYEVWANPEATALYYRLLRKSLFVELSDGARADIFRRANEGRISNEQVVTAPRINRPKWDDMLSELRKESKDENARFAFVFLLDDFTGSGMTLLRKEDDKWKGKLERFWDDIAEVLATHFESEWVLNVHHYVATSQAATAVQQSHLARANDAAPNAWFQRVEFTWGTVLPENFKVTAADEPEFAQLVNEFYDDSIETLHIKKGGKDARWGFSECGLPLVLEHNTPNNSIALLWAETAGGESRHAMRPLFRRRQRHL